jgi:hypothetical protein
MALVRTVASYPTMTRSALSGQHHGLSASEGLEGSRGLRAVISTPGHERLIKPRSQRTRWDETTNSLVLKTDQQHHNVAMYATEFGAFALLVGVVSRQTRACGPRASPIKGQSCC